MTPTDWVFQEGAGQEVILAAGVTLTFWNMQAGGSQYKDLLLDGEATETILSGDGVVIPTGTIPQFEGPDGITSMWVDAGGATRYLMVTTDLADLPEKVATLEETVTSLENVLSNVLYAIKFDPGTGEYPDIPDEISNKRYLVWIGPSAPADARDADLHFDTLE